MFGHNYSDSVTSTDRMYQHMLGTIITDGTELVTRNDTVKRIVGIVADIQSTPLLSVRKTAWRSALREWEWFMSGSNNIYDLHPSVRHWWKEWATPTGTVPFNYSKQFRRAKGEFGRIDQIGVLLEGIAKHPNSRRNVITTWNTQEMNDPLCPITNCHHSLTQAFVEGGKLYLLTNQRSADMVCGVPHNWIQTWAFLMWLAHRTGLQVGGFRWIGGDCHLYQAHYELADRIIAAEGEIVTPTLAYNPTDEMFRADDFTLIGEYKPLITDKAEMVV